MVSDEEQNSPSEFASLVDDILDATIQLRKRMFKQGLFLGERRDSSEPIDIPATVLARHAAMLDNSGFGHSSPNLIDHRSTRRM